VNANDSITAHLQAISGRDRSLSAALRRGAAACLEPLYRAGVAWRNRAYDLGQKPIHRLGRPVVSIGNLTAGGTGKTPMVMHCVQALREQSRTPAVLMRGYKAEAEGADEARELSQRLEGVPVVAQPDRVSAGRRLLEDRPDVDVLVLDDGFHHRRLHRDLDLVLIDATCPFGYERLLPRGLLREPPENLRRADAVIVTRADAVDAESLRRLDRRLETLHGRPPLAHACHQWAAVLDADDRENEMRQDDGVFAFCAIGNAPAFFAQVAGHATLLGSRGFADHHPYRAEDLRAVFAAARSAVIDCPATTEKDWVKLRPLLESLNDVPDIRRPHLSMAFMDGRNALTERLRTLAERS